MVNYDYVMNYDDCKSLYIGLHEQRNDRLVLSQFRIIKFVSIEQGAQLLL